MDERRRHCCSILLFAKDNHSDLPKTPSIGLNDSENTGIRGAFSIPDSKSSSAESSKKREIDGFKVFKAVIDGDFNIGHNECSNVFDSIVIIQAKTWISKN